MHVRIVRVILPESFFLSTIRNMRVLRVYVCAKMLCLFDNKFQCSCQFHLRDINENVSFKYPAKIKEHHCLRCVIINHFLELFANFDFVKAIENRTTQKIKYVSHLVNGTKACEFCLVPKRLYLYIHARSIKWRGTHTFTMSLNFVCEKCAMAFSIQWNGKKWEQFH